MVFFKLWNIQVVFLCLRVWKAYSYEFKVTVPSSLVMPLGEPAVLPCSFSLGSVWQPESIVITWQRGLEVVHSFYYNRDQLKHQSRQYVGRTRLYHSEMQNGNASLRLDNVTVKDMGEYICSVSSDLGSERKSFPVKVAALYSEPVLQFSVRARRVELVLTSGGGFPAPTLHWLQGHEDLTNSTQTNLTQNTDSGLYAVSSVLSVPGNSNATLNFILWNTELMQEIKRNISLVFEHEDIASARNGSFSHRERVVLLLPIGLLLLIIIGLLLNRQKMSKCTCHDDRT
ncbi:hypothetical protein ACEWY4_005410 [Coilia grayii]|uniref:Ig-like domain-containing protein n=1 Tax=Coilia grayii TaxID=363190 RepID=A0ABD1KIJ5_9TELE